MGDELTNVHSPVIVHWTSVHLWQSLWQIYFNMIVWYSFCNIVILWQGEDLVSVCMDTGWNFGNKFWVFKIVNMSILLSLSLPINIKCSNAIYGICADQENFHISEKRFLDWQIIIYSDVSPIPPPAQMIALLSFLNVGRHLKHLEKFTYCRYHMKNWELYIVAGLPF